MASRGTVLVVEDDAELRTFYRTALAFAGYEVQEAGTGLDALSIVDRGLPDILVLDLMLPSVNGYAVLEELAAQATTRDIPVVVVTGSTGPLEGLNVPCVLRKPVTPEQLITAIERCLASGTPPART